MMNYGGKDSGLIIQRSHLCQSNCLQSEKINHFRKPLCSKTGAMPLSRMPSIPSGQSKSWKSTKAIYPIGLGRTLTFQLVFVSPQNVQTGQRQDGWLGRVPGGETQLRMSSCVICSSLVSLLYLSSLEFLLLNELTPFKIISAKRKRLL